MRTPRKLLGAAWGVGLLLFLVGKASSRTAFIGSGWHGEHVREANVACRGSGVFETSLPKDKNRLTREHKMELEGEIASLTELAELKKALGATRKALFKYRLDDSIRQRNPDSVILLKQLYKFGLVKKKISQIMEDEEANEAMKVKVPTYTEWMETNMDLDGMKNRVELPAFRPQSRRPDLPLPGDYHFGRKFERKYGYKYEEPNAWEEYTAKGGEEWWNGQKQLKREEVQAKREALKEKYTERNAAWKKLWAAEAEVRRQELGRT